MWWLFVFQFTGWRVFIWHISLCWMIIVTIWIEGVSNRFIVECQLGQPTEWFILILMVRTCCCLIQNLMVLHDLIWRWLICFILCRHNAVRSNHRHRPFRNLVLPEQSRISFLVFLLYFSSPSVSLFERIKELWEIIWTESFWVSPLLLLSILFRFHSFL